MPETNALPPDSAASAYDVIVVGGGLSGCALACALSDGQRRILVLEARAGKNPRFNGELIHPSGVDLLDEIDVLGPLHEAGGADIEGFACVRRTGEPPTLLPYCEVEGSRPLGFAIDHHDLVATLRKRLAQIPGVELRTGERVTDLIRDRDRIAGVVTSSGPVRGHLVLAADGRHSKIRALVEIPERARLLSFTAAALLRDCRLPQPGYGHLFLGAWGPILVYPIKRQGAEAPSTDCRTCIDLPSELERGKDAVVERLRAEYLSHVPEGVRASLSAALEEGAIEMAANYSISTDTCTAPGLALVGDSAGCSHPITATGMTIALNDVRLVRRALEGVPLKDRERVDEALLGYQTARYRFVRTREVLADAIYEVFRGADDGTRAIREGIFAYWNGSRGARGRSMGLLSGHDSRLPSFLREYLTVVSLSTSTVLRGAVNEPTFPGRVRSLMGLAGKSFEKMGLVARHVRAGSMR
jgi:squalene monooxygenase